VGTSLQDDVKERPTSGNPLLRNLSVLSKTSLMRDIRAFFEGQSRTTQRFADFPPRLDR